jgi:hypothetical protein
LRQLMCHQCAAWHRDRKERTQYQEGELRVPRDPSWADGEGSGDICLVSAPCGGPGDKADSRRRLWVPARAFVACRRSDLALICAAVAHLGLSRQQLELRSFN